MQFSRRVIILVLSCFLATACHDQDQPDKTNAEKANIAVVEQMPGVTPFITNVALRLDDFTDLDSVTYTITPKPGTFSKPVSVTYTRARLERTGAWRPDGSRLTFAVFGLYANYQNAVTITATFRDASVHVEHLNVAAPVYAGQASVYNTPIVRTPRGAASPGFDYIMIQNGLSTPAVVDTDGNLRWIGTGLSDSMASLFDTDAFFVGALNTPQLFRIELDGTYAAFPIKSASYTNFHHDLVRGKTGLLAEFNAVEGGTTRIGSTLAEISPTGEVLKEWNMSTIFREAMRAGGDDPSNFVRDGVDWFHMNSAVYVAADDSILVSSRENFVAKLDYATGRIKWLFGDTTKHWYVDYPSLRALALRLTNGTPPIGQHSVSITSNGELLLFNNGTGSIEQPAGAATGVTLDYSTASRYAIDEQARTASETWAYSPSVRVYSAFCSSAYETKPGQYLLAYSLAEAYTRARLVGVDNAGNVAFDFEYPAGNRCFEAFNSKAINFSGLKLE